MRIADFGQVLPLLSLVSVLQTRPDRAWKFRSCVTGCERRYGTFPDAAPWPAPDQDRHRHIQRATPGQSSPFPPCAAPRLFDPGAGTLVYGHPSTHHSRQVPGCAWSWGNLLPASAGFPPRMFQDHSHFGSFGGTVQYARGRGKKQIFEHSVSNSHYGNGQSLHALTVVETSQTRSGNEPQYRFLCLVGARNGRDNFRSIRSATIMRIAA